MVSSPMFERVVVDSADSRRRITLDAPAPGGRRTWRR